MPIYKPKTSQQTHQPIVRKTLTITTLSDDGRGIADDHGRKVFVDGALPGETVVAVITQKRQKYSEAKVKEVVQVSAERLSPPCSVFERCGGCSVQYMSAEKQRSFKQAGVLSQLSRWAKIAPEQLLPAITGSEYGYRQRVRLSVAYSKRGDVSMGFRERHSRRLVTLSECMVLEPELQPLLPTLRQWLKTIKPNIVSHIELIRSLTVVGVVVRHTRPLPVSERQKLALILGKVNEVKLWFQGESAAELESINGDFVDPRLQYVLDHYGLRFSFHPQDFIQSNRRANQSMVEQAITLMAPKPDEYMVDLFCGIGNFSLPLAQRAKQVIGIEGMEKMVRRARENAEQNQISNIAFAARNLAAENIVIDDLIQGHRVDGILLDPPRSGARDICQNIMKLAPKRIVYVSCDSATFARDAQLLNDNGYHLSRLGIIDMFPQTSHIEVMGLFILHQ